MVGVLQPGGWSEGLGAVVLVIIAAVATSRLIHESIATTMMGNMFLIFSIPVLSLAFVVGVVAGRRLSEGPRRATMAVAVLLACGALTLLRVDGMSGDGSLDFAWRWAETHEQRLLAQADDRPTALPSSPAAADAGADWPGFRGPGRAGIVRGTQIETDWSRSPPVELWRRAIGPACSSFAVRGDFLYTQEQRGDDEIVACYKVTTGELVWRHGDAARFWDSHTGPGPRSTPTVKDGRVYTLGATGILNVLDADDGAVIWSRNAADDTEVRIPSYWWGFTSSPLVIDDLVIVATSGSLVAYDLATGEPRWFGPASGTTSYSSPHLMTIGGIPQVLLLSYSGAVSVAPADGTLLWEHAWQEGVRIVQPALTAEGDVLMSAGEGNGLRRLAIGNGPGGWTVEERWTSIGLKPSHSDFVVHDGHAYGFDGSFLASIDLEDGERRWKGGRYGSGQLVLLADQDLLLVVSERGEVALVRAAPDRFEELARFPAIEGKSWNHPVLVGDVLLVRNTQEMAAFRLSLAGPTSGS